MHEIYPIAKLGNAILVVNKADISYIGKEQALAVQCVLVDLKKREIEPPIALEKHLKFNPWEEITNEEERTMVLRVLNNKFSDPDIVAKIMKPLAENAVTDTNSAE